MIKIAGMTKEELINQLNGLDGEISNHELTFWWNYYAVKYDYELVFENTLEMRDFLATTAPIGTLKETFVNGRLDPYDDCIILSVKADYFATTPYFEDVVDYEKLAEWILETPYEEIERMKAKYDIDGICKKLENKTMKGGDNNVN